jgi:hypothetical protein
MPTGDRPETPGPSKTQAARPACGTGERRPKWLYPAGTIAQPLPRCNRRDAGHERAAGASVRSTTPVQCRWCRCALARSRPFASALATDPKLTAFALRAGILLIEPFDYSRGYAWPALDTVVALLGVNRTTAIRACSSWTPKSGSR